MSYNSLAPWPVSRVVADKAPPIVAVPPTCKVEVELPLILPEAVILPVNVNPVVAFPCSISFAINFPLPLIVPDAVILPTTCNPAPEYTPPVKDPVPLPLMSPLDVIFPVRSILPVLFSDILREESIKSM